MGNSRVLVLTGALAFVVTAPIAEGQFFPGFGLPVIDETVWGEQIIQTMKMVETIRQLQETYVKVKAQLDEAIRQAQFIKGMAARYRSQLVAWKSLVAVDTYGRNGRWVNAANTGNDAAGGWIRATSRLATYPAAFGDIEPGQQERKRLEVGALELSDGVAINAIDTVGRIRASGPNTEAKLLALEADSFSEGSEMHVLAANLDKANSLAILQIKESLNTNKVLAAQTELALIQRQRERESAAYELEADANFRARGRESMRAAFADASSLIRYRLP